MKLAARRSLWHGTTGRSPRRLSITGPTPRASAKAERRRHAARSARSRRRPRRPRNAVEPAGDRRARVQAAQQRRCLSAIVTFPDLALDEARDEVSPPARRTRRPPGAMPERARRASDASCSTARSIPSSSVSLPPIRSTNDSPPATTLKLWFVIPPPSGSTESTPSGQTRSTTSASLASSITLESVLRLGSNSGSAATSPATQLAEDLDLDRPARPRHGRPAGTRRRSTARPCSRSPPLVTRPTSSPSTRTGSEPRATARGSASRRQQSRRSGSSREERSRPMNLLVELDGEAEPGLERRVVRA